jgi:acyl-CoA synthetase (AMP-forming)/AMP-acid ligase II
MDGLHRARQRRGAAELNRQIRLANARVRDQVFGRSGQSEAAAFDDEGTIKSGGEWISSIELESIAVTHPAVAQAAVIAIAHARWQERPLLVVVLKPGAPTSSQALLEFFEDKVAKWWIPDAVEFVDALPLTATGKISKLQLRERFG